MRGTVKNTAESALCVLGATRLFRRRHVGSTIVLAYHNIVPDRERGTGDASLHLPQREFARQLELLMRTHDIVSLSELRTAPSSLRPRAVITFDDAYWGALHAGVDELSKRNLPATIFVAPAFVNGHTYWWDVLAGDNGRGLDPGIRALALDELAGRDAAVREWADSKRLPLRLMPLHQTVASEADLAAADATGLITFGSHTWSHANLLRLPPQEMKEEMLRPLEWLRASFTNALPWLSYPYGLRNEAVEKTAAQIGYEGAFLIDGGWVTDVHGATARCALPRLNVPAGISERGFEIRTSGLLS